MAAIGWGVGRWGGTVGISAFERAKKRERELQCYYDVVLSLSFFLFSSFSFTVQADILVFWCTIRKCNCLGFCGCKEGDEDSSLRFFGFGLLFVLSVFLSSFLSLFFFFVGWFLPLFHWTLSWKSFFNDILCSTTSWKDLVIISSRLKKEEEEEEEIVEEEGDGKSGRSLETLVGSLSFV